MSSKKPLSEARKTALRASLRRRRLHRLFHFTPADHLRSIFRTGALFCRRELIARKIPFSGHGWGYLGKEQEFGDYVICGFCPHWGMIRREERPIAVMKVESEILLVDGALICPGNSASNEYTLDNLRTNDPFELFDGLFPDPTGNWPTNYQAEVLIPNMIPLNCVKEVLAPRDDHRRFFLAEARAGLRENRTPLSLSEPIRFVVDPRSFPSDFNPPLPASSSE